MSPASPLPDRWPDGWPFPPDASPTLTERAMVVTTDAHATDVGVRVLRAGGNAVDAATAVSFALAVVNPEAGNVGGGGFMIVRPAAGDTHALDYRSAAPAAAHRDVFLDERGEATDRSTLGALAAAVPGSVRGVWEAHRRFGRTPWPELIQPAVELAGGFEVRPRFLASFPDHVVEGLRRFDTSREIFFPGGRLPTPGEIFRQPDLAATLVRIRDRGPDGFYGGETAELIVAEMRRSGGLITREDLAAYRAHWREPIRVAYRGHTLVSMPPSSSGGITLAAIARMVEAAGDRMPPWHSTAHVHLLAEVWRRAYADRNEALADPDFAELPLVTLASAGYARRRMASFDRERATPSSEVSPGVDARPRGGDHTTHFSIVDAEGDAVSVTTTVNTWYGSKLVAGGTGVLLNNEMDDLSTRPGTPNHFGLVQGELNAVEPRKRPLSAMTPTLVLGPDGDLRLVVGTPGGATIITTVFQVVSNLLDHDMSLPAAVHAPRVHHQHLPDEIVHEPGALPEEAVRSLESMGHAVRARDEWSGDVQAVLVRPDGTLEGVSDPRRGGVAAGL